MFEKVIQRLLSGDASIIFDPQIIASINSQLIYLMNKSKYTKEEYEVMGELIHIGNIVYNNTDLDDCKQPIDNDAYDILLEKYRVYNPNFQVGAEPVRFNTINTNDYENSLPFISFHETLGEDSLYKEEVFDKRVNPLYVPQPFISYEGKVVGRKYRDVSHGNNTLVGTLDKCKCVLNSQAEEKGYLKDPAVKILERDFFQSHFKMGLIDRHTIFGMMLELKYDGLSVVVTIKNKRVIYAVSRGDTGADKATDYTSILYGYYFPFVPEDVELDIKCEAVMTHVDLARYNAAKNNNYKNCRSAIIGLFSSNEGALYQEYITLIPLDFAHSSISGKGMEADDLDRVTKVEFINKYLISKEYLRATYIEGDYETILFMIKKFVDEAELIRPLMPTMYDGVVISYVDTHIREVLGRENFINKYSVAVKFNTMKKMTELLAITYTVGQDGSITPMAHYKPVTFLGTIHTKSSLASVKRFNENRFKIGNIIEVEYRNDVMPYVSTPLLDHNTDNPNPILQFITHCPACGTELVFSSTGKSAKCPNNDCRGRVIARLANMMDKLGLKDFAEASMEKIGKYHLYELVELKEDYLMDILGEVNAHKFVERIEELQTKPMYDYEIIGSLGFSGIAQETWKKIFSIIDLFEFIHLYNSNELEPVLKSIKGIGPLTIQTIMNEYPYFEKDIIFITTLNNIKSSKGLVQKSIRVTGFRDNELMEYLKSLGYDASDKGVTKTTDILLIPYEGFTSSKMNKVGTNTLIIPINEFRDNMQQYLQSL